MQQQTKNPVTPEEFAKLVKEKYPEYADVEDMVLVERVLEKYPEYRSKVKFDQSAAETPVAEPVKKKEEPVSSVSSEDQKLESQSSQEIPSTSSDSKEVEPEPKEEEGFWSNKWREIRTGSTMLGESLASYLEGVYDIAAIPQNLIAGATGAEWLEASSEKFKKTTGIENPILDYYAAETKKLKEETNDYYSEKYGTDENGNAKASPSEHISEGNYFAAFETLGGLVSESMPTSLAMMAGGAAAGSVGKLAAYSTPAFMNSSREDLKNANPKAFEEMSEAERTIKAFGMAGAETVFSAIGTGTIGKVYGDIVKKEGVEQGSLIFKQGLIKFYESALKKYGMPISAAGEGIEEVATTITQNMIKGAQNPFAGVADSFLAGVGGGVTHGAPINAVKAVDHIQTKIGERNIKKQIENSEVYQRAGDLFKEENTTEIDDVQVTIAGKKHSRAAIERDLNKQVNEGLMTEEEAARNLQLFDQTASFVKETQDADLSAKQQVRAVNLLKERQQLSDKVKDKNKALFKGEHDRIKEIDQQLENLRYGTRYETETEQTKEGAGTGNQTETAGEGASSQTESRGESENAERSTEPESNTQEEKVNSGTTVGEVMNRPVRVTSLGGSKLETPIEGDMYQEGQTVVVEDANGTIHEIGNVDEISERDLADAGIEYSSGIEITPDGTLNYQGTEWRLQDELPTGGIEYAEDGSVKTVSLKENGTEKTTMITGPEATDAAYQVLLKQAQTPEQVEKVNQALEQDEQFQNELRKIEESSQEETGGDSEQDIEQEQTTEGEVDVQENDSFTETEQSENVNTDIKERSKQMAKALRENLKIKRDPNTLNSDPVGALATTAWNGAVEAMAVSIEAGGTVASAINKAVESFKQSEYYKSLEGNKTEELNKFRKELEESSKPLLDEERVEKVKSATKQDPKNEGTNKVNTTKRVLIKEIASAESAAVRKALRDAKNDKKSSAKEIKEILKNFIVKGPFTPAKSRQLVSKALSIDVTSEKQVEKFLDQYGKAVAMANAKVDAKELDKNIAIAKKRIKKNFGKWSPVARKLTYVDPVNVPANLMSEYAEVIRMLADRSNKTLDWDRANDLLDAGLEQAYNDQADAAYREKLAEIEKNDEDKSKQVTLLKETLSNLRPNWSELGETGRSVVRKFTNIPQEWLIEHLDKSELSAVIKSLNAVDGKENPSWLDNKTLNTVVMQYEAQQLAEDIVEKVGDKFIKPVRNIAQSVKDKLSGKKNKDYKTDEYMTAINSVMVQHVDTVITNIKGLSIYKELFHPITSQFNKSHEETSKVERKLSELYRAAEKSRGKKKPLIPEDKASAANANYSFDLQTLLQLYFRQKEHNNEANRRNPDVKTFSAKDHVEATLASKSIDYSEGTKDRIKKILDEFSTDGEFDVKKVEKHLTAQENVMVEFMEKALQETKERNMVVNDHRRGETLPYPEDYFPRKSRQEGKSHIDGVDMTSKMGKLLSSNKSTSSNRRKANEAEALDFDTFGNFLNHVKEINLEYNLSESVKQVGMVLTHLKNADNSSVGMLSNAIENGLKIMMDAEFGSSIYTPTSKINRAYRFLVRRTFNRMLIGLPRLVMADVPSSYGSFLLAYGDKLPATLKSTKRLNKEYETGAVDENGDPIKESFKDILFKSFGSTHMSRLGGNRSVDLKESETSTFGKRKFKEFDPSRSEKFLDLMEKNLLSDASNIASDAYYKVADAPAKLIWSYRFEETFKKATGKDFSTDSFVSDSNYKKQYEQAIKKAIKEADKSATIAFNTATKTEQKISNQAGRGTLQTSINSFMRSFTYNENRAWWDSFNSIFGKGTMDRGEAIRTQILINSRGIGYSYAIQTMMSTLLQFFIPSLEEDEELEERAWYRALAQHGFLLLAGNRGLIFNIAAAATIESAREIYQNDKLANDPWMEGEKYTRDQSLLYTPSRYGTFGQFVGMGGAEGFALQTVIETLVLGKDIAEKMYTGEEITKEDLVDWKTYQISVGLLSQVFGLPINRAGSLWQKYEEHKVENSGW